MRNLGRTLTLALLGLTVAAGTADAQGKGNGNGKAKGAKGNGKGDRAVVVRDGDVWRGDRDRDRDSDWYRRNGRRVPPGLAKKPGQMPPGQYKKIYSTREGASVLGDILGRRGYRVTRTGFEGDTRYVWYRGQDGVLRRAIVRPGNERLQFANVPQAVLAAVLQRLY